MSWNLRHPQYPFNPMAALNLSSSSKLPTFSNVSSRYAPSISFYPLPKRALFFSSIALGRTTFSRKRNPRAIVSAVKKLAETESMAIPSEDSITEILPSESGVYAVYGGGGDIQFVGITRNLAASILGHKKSVPQLCSSVKVGVVEEPDKNSLTEAWKSWMEEHIASTGKVPVGNEPGNSTWVKKSPKKKSDLRLTPGRHVQLTVPLEDLIDRLVKENKVVAFIKGSRNAPLCGFSQRVVAILESQGVDYESLDVLDEEYNYGLRETLKKYSSWPTFPQIFVDGELVGGCDILTSMYEKGELSGLFK